MTWRDVFDGHKATYHDRDHAARVAHTCGYKFLAWNGDIYFIVAGNGTTAPTGIHVDQLNLQVLVKENWAHNV